MIAMVLILLRLRGLSFARERHGIPDARRPWRRDVAATRPEQDPFKAGARFEAEPWVGPAGCLSLAAAMA